MASAEQPIVALEHDARAVGHQLAALEGREDLVANQADTVDTVLRWLGLDPAARNSGSDDNGIITTASMEQVRQPLHNRSVGRWKHYSELFGN